MARIRSIKPDESPRIQSVWGFDTWTLYLISEFGSPCFKIGTAWHPRRRMSTLQCGNPRKLSLAAVYLGSSRDCKAIEATILDRFASRRIAGEWIHASFDDIVEAINDEAER